MATTTPQRPVLILHQALTVNATEDELDTLNQVNHVKGALESLGFTTVVRPVALKTVGELPEVVKSINPVFVFNLVETLENSGRLFIIATSLLDFTGVPYTGNPTAPEFICSNKTLAKDFMHGYGIPTPRCYRFSDLAGELKDFVPGRYIIKSVWEHSSIGIGDESVVTVKTVAELKSAVERRMPAIGGEGFAEQYIEGREFNVSVLAGLPFHPAELYFFGYPDGKPQIVDYNCKWNEGTFEWTHCDRRFLESQQDQPLLQELRRISKLCWQSFHLQGYARVDFRVDPSNQPYVLEINTNPDITPDSGFTVAAQHSKLDLPQVVEIIIRDSCPTVEIPHSLAPADWKTKIESKF